MYGMENVHIHVDYASTVYTTVDTDVSITTSIAVDDVAKYMVFD